ncbi:MAG: hemolysin III family protein [Gammaproteobacteria bacterium]|jgi:hemolysin III|nr:MAG: hemolysin III family protein [Gammaproteobacteria bacterium]
MKKTVRGQTRAEEAANSISHGLGFLLAVAGAPLLIVAATRRGTLADVIAVTVFAAAMAVLYLASTIYHALPEGRAKHLFHVLDHAAIYLLIAGTYTPFTLGVLQGGWGWSLFGVIWGLAIAGVLMKMVAGIRWHGVSTAIYVGMGWLALIAAKPLWESLPLAGLLWLLAGGVAYTAGVAFYIQKSLRFSHLVWHLFVLAGTGCHFIAVLFYAI